MLRLQNVAMGLINAVYLKESVWALAKPFTKLYLLCIMFTTNQMFEICSISTTVYKLTNY